MAGCATVDAHGGYLQLVGPALFRPVRHQQRERPAAASQGKALSSAKKGTVFREDRLWNRRRQAVE